MSTANHVLENENKDFDVFKYNKYMALYPFNDKNAFKEWLAINHLTHDAFLALFDKNNKTEIDTENCPWMDFLLNEYKPAKDIKDKYSNQFGVFIDFIVEKATADFSTLLESIDNVNDYNINPNVFIQIFTNELVASFFPIITPTLTLELNVARVSNLLIGETSEQRYSCFIDLLNNKEFVLKIFDEYPLLWEKLLCKTQNALNQSVEFYQRLCNDYLQIEKQFGSLGAFKGFTGEKGDDHNNGRSVRICQFENLSIVYKPRSLKADIYFQKLLLDLNGSANTSFKTFYSIDKGEYGWCEKVLHKECKSKLEIENYYLRMGHYVALLYLLNSSDFHFENVISHGEHPMLIDLESLFHIYFTNGDENTCDTKKCSFFVHTVLDSMLLPYKTKFIGQENFTDISAIGYERNKTNNNIVNELVNNARDDMSLVFSEKKSGQIAPTPCNINQFGINLNGVTQQLLKGFKDFYEYTLKKPALLFKNQNFQKMYSLNFRCIVRATNQYAVLINHTNHPNSLRSYSNRLLHITQKLWVNTTNKKWLPKLCYYEYCCLISGNVPIFKFTPLHHHIIQGDGNKIKNLQNLSIKERVEKLQTKLSKKDLYSQMWIIEASMQTKNTTLDKKFFKLNNYDDFKNLDSVVYKHLNETALQDEKDIGWLSVDKLVSQEFNLSKTKSLELFDGGHGALLFLAYYATLSGHDAQLNKINYSIDESMKHYFNLKFESAGGIDGICGYIYGLAKLYDLTKNKTLHQFALCFVNNIRKVINKEKSYDIISGSAGQVLCLLSAYKSFKNLEFLNLSVLAADHIYTLYKSSQSIVGLTDNSSDINPLGGFSHGVSGIAYSLLRIKSETSTKKYDDLINDCIAYEDQLYSHNINNYIDLRNKIEGQDNQRGMVAWCHGVVGIGLSRIEILNKNLLPEKAKQFKSEIRRNVQTILSNGFGDNHSLCHGDAGSLEYLYQVSEHYPHIYSKNKFNKQLNIILSLVKAQGLKNGVPFNKFYPGLFIGSIGLAYQVLRFKNPKIVKNILLLN